MYAHHASRSGIWGIAGYVLMMLFAAYLVYMLLYEAGPIAALATDPQAERLFAAGGVVRQGELRTWSRPVQLAPIVYGIALLRAGIYSRWAGWLIIAFVPVFLVLSTVVMAMPSATQETLLDFGALKHRGRRIAAADGHRARGRWLQALGCGAPHRQDSESAGLLKSVP